MIKINLLPIHERTKKESIRKQLTTGALIVVLAVAALGYLTFMQMQKIDGLNKTIEVQKAKQAKLEKEVGDLDKFKRKKDDLQKRKDAINELSKNRLGIVQVLDNLSKAKPEDLYFLNLQQVSSGAPWKDFSMVLKGVAVDNETIAQFMRNLGNFPMFDVDLDYTRSRGGGKGTTFQEFSLKIQVTFKDMQG